MPTASASLYVAAYSNPNRTSITTDWLPVKSCTSEIGKPSNYLCSDTIRQFSSSDTLCYTKLDIQISYTNIGTLSNPQHILSAVIFHFQGQVSENLSIIVGYKCFGFDIGAIVNCFRYACTCDAECHVSRYISCNGHWGRQNTSAKYSFTGWFLLSVLQ